MKDIMYPEVEQIRSIFIDFLIMLPKPLWDLNRHGKKAPKKQKSTKKLERKYYGTDDYIINGASLYPVPLLLEIIGLVWRNQVLAWDTLSEKCIYNTTHIKLFSICPKNVCTYKLCL